MAHAQRMDETLVVHATAVDIETLARAASAGDPRALNALLAAVRPEALRLCARFLPNREDAEEACQDTLLGGGPRDRPVRRAVLVPYLALPARRQPGPIDLPGVAPPVRRARRPARRCRTGRIRGAPAWWPAPGWTCSTPSRA